MLEPIEYIKNFFYNVNLMSTSRQLNRMIFIQIDFGSLSEVVEKEFDRIFFEFLLSSSKNTQRFKYMEIDDIILFNKKTQQNDS